MTKTILALLLAVLCIPAAQARSTMVAAPYPLHLKLAQAKADLFYPSVAGGFLVYTKRDTTGFSVVRVALDQPQQDGLVLHARRRHGEGFYIDGHQSINSVKNQPSTL